MKKEITVTFAVDTELLKTLDTNFESELKWLEEYGITPLEITERDTNENFWQLNKDDFLAVAHSLDITEPERIESLFIKAQSKFELEDWEEHLSAWMLTWNEIFNESEGK